MNLTNITEGEFDYALMANFEKKTPNSDFRKFFYLRRKAPKDQNYRDGVPITDNTFERSIRFMDSEDYLDTLTLDLRQLRNLDEVFRMFDRITSNKAFTVPCRAY